MLNSNVIRVFDPWRKGSLCTCPFKYTVNVYTGCGHRCIYCYITSYIRDAFNPRPKKDFIRLVMRDIQKIPASSIIDVSTSSDPYTPPEEKLGLTRKLLGLIMKNFRVKILTKSDLVVRDIDILKRGSSIVSMTITTMDERVAQIIEPYAPSPSKRIKALSMISKYGIPTILRLDPILPFVNDSEKNIRNIIRDASKAGVKHIVSSTYKAKPDSLARIIRSFPDLGEKYRDLYIVKGSRIHGAYYLSKKIRLDLMRKVKEIASDYGLTFATCREGLVSLHDKGTICDGSHLFKAFNR
ncbi:MAG: radical SAM protein [Thermoproteales archaeon]|nr:radical SAM protein [Thermoproteales archaeon]